eukprot:TRINITY_DN6483_c0_g1_i16.p1 TRINITY_DN6483_c0_g1~~TRINITY_DN6483_c0_g1_i16.p1  ORF type:complete len:210 (+),score=48.02 TRINITY_DN6483_c0_g1_i16:1-630(+)
MWERGGADVPIPDCDMLSCVASPYTPAVAAVGCDGRLHVIVSRRTLELVKEESDVADVALGYEHVLVLRRDGSVRGFCTADGIEQLGQGDVPDFGDRRAVAVSAGMFHSAVLLEGGDIVCFGKEDSGRCDVPSGISAREVSCGGSFTAAVTTTGRLVTFGSCPTLRGASGGIASVASGWGAIVAVTPDGSILSCDKLADPRLDDYRAAT